MEDDCHAMPDFARRWHYRFTKPMVKAQSHYPKLKVIQTSNQGVAATRNQMAVIATLSEPLG